MGEELSEKIRISPGKQRNLHRRKKSWRIPISIMKNFDHFWKILKLIIITLIGLNFIPIICIAVVYFRGNLHEVGFKTPYIIGWSIQIVVLFAYGIKEIFNPRLPE